MEKKVSQNRRFWTEAATGGLVLGLILAAVASLSYLLRQHERFSLIAGILNFAAIIVIGYIWGRRMAESRGEEGFPFGKAFQFLLMIMFFAGFVSGLGSYILQGIVDPDYYQGLIEATLNKTGFNGFDPDLIAAYFKSPLLMIFNGIFTLICQGGLVSLVIAALVKKTPNLFSGGNGL